MKTLIAITLLVLISTCAFAADVAPTKVSLSADGTAIKDVVAQLTQQSGAMIVLDPKAQGTVNLTLQDTDLSQALDVITKLNKLTWKKLQFAKPENDPVKLEQIKSAILTLATMPMVAVSVDDPASKTTSMFAKNLPTAPDTSAIKLPEGYTWTTAYVILAPEAAPVASNGNDSRVKTIAESQARTVAEMANMSSEERKQIFATEFAAQMSMTPEARQSLLRDRMQAMFGLDQQTRDQLRQDMHNVFRDMPHGDRQQGQNGGQRTRRGDHQAQ